MKVWIFGTGLMATTGALADASLAEADRWHISLDLPAMRMSDVRSVLEIRHKRDGRFRAHSRPGALRDFQGFWRGFFGRIMKPELRRGAWLHLVDGQLDPDQGLSATLKSVMLRAPMQLECPAASGPWQCRLEVNGEVVGSARLQPAPDSQLPIADYEALLERIEATARAQIYLPQLLDEAGWKAFVAAVRDDLPKVMDDPDMLVAWYGAAGKLPVSHIMLLRGGPAMEDMFASPTAPVAELLRLRWQDSVAILRIPSFAVAIEPFAEQLAVAFSSLEQARALVLDLRGNTGGNLSSMLVSAHLMDETADAGYFVSRSWQRLYDDEPTPLRAIDRLPVIDEPDLARFMNHLEHDGGVQGRVQPRLPRFDGPVYVLIDRWTASASEPLVWHLQHRGATLVGERTAGAMLSSARFDVGNGWGLILPVADYHTATGERLEGRGIEPDHPHPSEQALEAAIDLIRARAEPLGAPSTP
jgi:hypothetical protein